MLEMVSEKVGKFVSRNMSNTGTGHTVMIQNRPWQPIPTIIILYVRKIIGLNRNYVNRTRNRLDYPGFFHANFKKRI